MTTELHHYRGGRHRPENAGAVKYPALRRDQVARGTCRMCGKGKVAHQATGGQK